MRHQKRSKLAVERLMTEMQNAEKNYFMIAAQLDIIWGTENRGPTHNCSEDFLLPGQRGDWPLQPIPDLWRRIGNLVPFSSQR